MKKILLVLGLCAAGYLGYAAYALDDLIKGILAGDETRIATHVDFPSARESIKAQLDSQVLSASRGAATNADDAGAQIGAGLAAAFGPALINSAVDGLLTPAGIAALIAKDKKPESKTESKSDYVKILRSIRPLSATSYQLVNVARGTSATIMLKDWTWKVTEVQIPSDLFNMGGR